MKPFEGETKSEFEKIMESYTNFMMSKIIANTRDLVGLVLYNLVQLFLFRIINKTHWILTKFSQLKNWSNPLHFQLRMQEVYSKITLKNMELSQKRFPYIMCYGFMEMKSKNCKFYLIFRDSAKNHLRLFLFTADDCPHAVGDERREQAINHARQLASKGVQIELFPIRKAKRCSFDIKKFYQ